MQEQTPEQQPNAPIRWYLGAIWLGMVAFGVVNFLLFFLTASLSLGIVAGLIYLLALGAAAAALYYALQQRNLAIGLMLGFVVMSLVSSGTCTLLAPSRNYEFIEGAVLYVFALIAVGVVAIIEHFFFPPWKRS